MMCHHLKNISLYVLCIVLYVVWWSFHVRPGEKYNVVLTGVLKQLKTFLHIFSFYQTRPQNAVLTSEFDAEIPGEIRPSAWESTVAVWRKYHKVLERLRGGVGLWGADVYLWVTEEAAWLDRTREDPRGKRCCREWKERFWKHPQL